MWRVEDRVRSTLARARPSAHGCLCYSVIMSRFSHIGAGRQSGPAGFELLYSCTTLDEDSTCAYDHTPSYVVCTKLNGDA